MTRSRMPIGSDIERDRRVDRDAKIVGAEWREISTFDTYDEVLRYLDQRRGYLSEEQHDQLNARWVEMDKHRRKP